MFFNHRIFYPNNIMPKFQFLKIASIFIIFCIDTDLFAAEINQPMPSCIVSSLTEERTENLQQYKGQVIYVDFWASWCGPCAESFPFLNAMHQKFKDQGLQIVGINLDEDLKDAETFLVKTPASFKLVKDTTKQCAINFDVKAMPSSYLIDRKGNIHHIHLGFRTADTKELEALIAKTIESK